MRVLNHSRTLPHLCPVRLAPHNFFAIYLLTRPQHLIHQLRTALWHALVCFQAYYDLSGGKITFHSKLRVPVPSGYSLSPTPEPTVIVQNQPGGDGSSPAPDGSTTPVPDPPQPPPEPSPSPPPYTVPTDPVSTPTSYLDPNGIDVYGYATLDGMRNDNGDCRWVE